MKIQINTQSISFYYRKLNIYIYYMVHLFALRIIPLCTEQQEFSGIMGYKFSIDCKDVLQICISCILSFVYFA